MDVQLDPGPLEDAARVVLDDLVERRAVARLLERDHTLWSDDPTELAERLGWLDAPERFAHEVSALDMFAADVRAAGFTDVIVSGMGGSSLFPEVLARTYPATGLRLRVLDSTHPTAVLAATDGLDLAHTLIVVSSKSGRTIETRSHLDHLWALLRRSVDDPGAHVVAITDPGSDLQRLAEERGFLRVFVNPPDVGGRFSALTFFGLVPAALLGVDVADLVDSARSELAAVREDDPTAGVLRVAALLAAGARNGRDALALSLPDELSSFGLWVEQLVAESTGKHGVGVLPIVDEPVDVPVPTDRVIVDIGRLLDAPAVVEDGHPLVRLGYDGTGDLGAQVMFWELVTALIGAALPCNPFDQPDVASAKTATAAALEARRFDLPAGSLTEALAAVGPGDTVTLLAFTPPDGALAAELPAIRRAIAIATGVTTAVGIGPRYLHSTGQLHKGGPDRHTFIVTLDLREDDGDVAIPSRPYTFAELFRAQAAGDVAALQAAGRRVTVVTPEELRSLR